MRTISLASITGLPSRLYHGSQHAAEKGLKSSTSHGEKHTEWDNGLGNDFVYACTDRDTAVLMGWASYLESKFGMKSFHSDDKEMTIRLVGVPKTALPDLYCDVYLHTVVPSVAHGWEKVDGKNGLENEWRTKRAIPRRDYQIEKVDLRSVVPRYKVSFE